MAEIKAKRFKNFTKYDFTWKHNGMEYTFPAGSTIFLESDKADHFAKHLIDEELNRLHIVTSNVQKRAEFLELCFPTDEVVTPLEALNINENAKLEEQKKEVEFEDLQKVEEKKPVGRPKKENNEK